MANTGLPAPPVPPAPQATQAPEAPQPPVQPPVPLDQSVPMQPVKLVTFQVRIHRKARRR